MHSKLISFYFRLTDNLVALKEIRLEHEEGAPCTAIREGNMFFSCLYCLKNKLAISLLLSFTSMCLLLFVIIPYEYCFFFSGSFSVKRFEACKYCYSSRHCSHAKVSHTGIWISGKCHCMFITGCYVAACIDVILLNVIHLDTVYWGFLPAVCWFWCLVLFVCLFSQEKDLKQYMDDCGGIMSMNNVRVRANKIFVSIIFSENVGALLILTR